MIGIMYMLADQSANKIMSEPRFMAHIDGDSVEWSSGGGAQVTHHNNTMLDHCSISHKGPVSCMCQNRSS